MATVPASRPLPTAARLLLTPLAAVLYALGWSAGLVVAAVLWCAAAVRVGWHEALR